MAASSLFRRVSSLLPRPFVPSLSLEKPLADATFGPSSLAPCLPHLPFDAHMDLMAVPKKKVSRHKKGLRNGPKALKPVPVIVRCKCCGRVKLPHFYCCSGERGVGGGSI